MHLKCKDSILGAFFAYEQENRLDRSLRGKETNEKVFMDNIRDCFICVSCKFIVFLFCSAHIHYRKNTDNMCGYVAIFTLPNGSLL